jgi:hypothetical protein
VADGPAASPRSASSSERRGPQVTYGADSGTIRTAQKHRASSTPKEFTLMPALLLETKPQANRTTTYGAVALAPPVSADYWLYRVKLSDTQAMLGFPKYATIGVGFAREDCDYNANLPYTCDAKAIYAHIRDNKGDPRISDSDCLAAIRMIQDAARAR